MTIKRITYQSKARELFSHYPALAILGPRQCGKTTFAKDTFGSLEYLDLELPSDFSKISSDAELFLSSRHSSIIIDAAQTFFQLK